MRAVAPALIESPITINKSGTSRAKLFADANGNMGLATAVTAPASGTNNVFLGNSTGGASYNGNNAIFIGNNARAGNVAHVNMIAIGQNSRAAQSAIALGDAADTVTASSAIAIGNTAVASANHSIAIGSSAAANTGQYTIAIGRNTSATAAGAVSIGMDSSGNGASSTVANQFTLGTVNHAVRVMANFMVADVNTFNVTSAGRMGLNAPIATDTIARIGAVGVGHFNSASDIYGVRATPVNSGLGNVVGLYTEPWSDGAGTIAEMTLGKFAGKVNNATGIVTTFRGVRTMSPILGATSTITTAIGLDIDAQKVTGVTNGYGIRQLGANDLNSFAAPIQVGTNPALSGGVLRVPNGLALAARNAANTADKTLLWTDSGDNLIVEAAGGTMYFRTGGATRAAISSAITIDAAGRLQWDLSTGDTGLARAAAGVVRADNALAVTGLTGATAASRYVGATNSGAPTSGTFVVGDFVVDRSGNMWVCIGAGTPGMWAPMAPPLTPWSTYTPEWTAGGSGGLAIGVGGFITGIWKMVAAYTMALRIVFQFGSSGGGAGSGGFGFSLPPGYTLPSLSSSLAAESMTCRVYAPGTGLSWSDWCFLDPANNRVNPYCPNNNASSAHAPVSVGGSTNPPGLYPNGSIMMQGVIEVGQTF